MTTETLKSLSITDADATPVVRESSGIGGGGELKQKNDFVTTTTGKTVGSIYRLVRVRSNAIIKQVIFESAAQSASTAFDFGLYYSDTLDGTSAANVAASATAISAAFFASAVAVTSAVTPTDITNESGTYTVDKRNNPIWQAVGLSTDPGGYFDICATSTATIAAGALMGIDVRYVQPGD